MANCFAIVFIWEPLFFGVSSAARVAGNSTLIWALPRRQSPRFLAEDTRGLKDEKGEKKQKEAVPQGPPLFFLEMVFSS
jgi:hypothetical protein